MVLGHNIEDGKRTEDVQISEGITLDSMLLVPETLQGLKNSGFYKPSPIQLHGIPLGKCGFDLLLEAKSGTGKTAVFSIIALEQLDLTKGLQAVVLAPTREIAFQICDVIKQIGTYYAGLTVEVVMGGLPLQEDIKKFKDDKAHIVVGSPGRLRHLIRGNNIDISAVRLLVLDEADKLLENSFLADVNYIFSILPKHKQVIMSSATYSENTTTFIKKHVQNAQHICPDSNNILLGIKQKVTIVNHNLNIVKQTQYRFDELMKILSKHAFKQCLIFCNYQARIGDLHKMLKKHKWPAEQLSGQQEQLERLDALKSLQEYKCRILISTDLAARGIDASNVDLVINFEPPFEWQTYLHRIGRAGRFGSYGVAITILSKGKEQEKFAQILSTIKAPINLTNLWLDDQITNEDVGLKTVSTLDLSESSITPVPVDLRMEQCENLWKLLISKHKENKEDIENFENLCNSFNSVDKLKFESFSDLVSSLEDCKHKVPVNGTNNSYTHLKMPLNSIPEYIILNTESCSKETKVNSTTNRNSNLAVEINNNNSEDISDIQNKDNQTVLENVNKKPYYITCVNDSSEDVKRKEVGSSIDGSDYEYSAQHLLNAGLPTAFGRPKINRKAVKLNCKKYGSMPNCKNKNNEKYSEVTEETNKNRLSYKDTEDSETSQGFYNIRTKGYAKNNMAQNYPKRSIRKSGYDVDDECYDIGENTTTHYNQYLYSQPHKTASHYTYRKGSRIETNLGDTFDNSNEDCTNSASNLYYIHWYNCLKFNIKQVEHAIYIDEMSKLHFQ